MGAKRAASSPQTHYIRHLKNSDDISPCCTNEKRCWMEQHYRCQCLSGEVMKVAKPYLEGEWVAAAGPTIYVTGPGDRGAIQPSG